MKDQATDKRSPIIIWALVLTAILLVGFGWLLSRTVTCPDGWWLVDRLGCLDPNALGDTFAGAFAPVAFVWLVAAVMLQRNELAAQRQELRETRAVASQQVAEAQKNVELIGEQTRLLRLKSEQEAKADADSTVRSLIVLFNKTMLSAVEGFAVRDKNKMAEGDGWQGEEECKTIGFSGPFSQNSEDMCRELIEQLGVILFELENLWVSSADTEFYGLPRVRVGLEILSKIVTEYDRTSVPMQGMLDYIGAKEGVEAGGRLSAWLMQHGRAIPGRI